jgi:hypothetical protein
MAQEKFEAATARTAAQNNSASTDHPLQNHQSLRDLQAASAAALANHSADSHLPAMTMTDFKSRAENLLSRVIPAGTDIFSSNDLLGLLNDPKIQGQDALALATLYELSIPPDVGLMPDGSRAPLASRAEIQALPNLSLESLAKIQNPTPEDRVAADALTMEPFLQQRAANPTNPALFSDGKNPLGSIKAADVHQGASGDCYFEASLAETAQQNPSVIRNAIHANSNGTYTVTFQGDKQHPVTVTSPTETELALYNGGSPDGSWAPIMEKAFGQYTADVLHRQHTGMSNEDAAAAGDPYDAMQLLNGHNIKQMVTPSLISPAVESASSPVGSAPASAPASADGNAPDSEAAIAARLTSTLHAGRTAILSTTGDAHAVAGLTDNHSYAIVNFTPGQNGGQVTLRNPDSSGNEPVTQTVSLDKLYKMAAAVDLESGDPEETAPFATVPSVQPASSH